MNEEKIEGSGKMRIVKQIIIFSLVMVMGCNSGLLAEEKAKNEFLSSIANLGKGFLKVFVVIWGDMVSGTLGIKADTKKSDIGKYFSDIENTMKTTKTRLNEILDKNGHYGKIKEKVAAFIATIDKIAEGAKEAAKGAVGSDVIGGAIAGQDAVPGEVSSVNALVKGIKEIVDVVLKKDEGNANATKTGDTEKKSIGKLLGANGTDGTEQQAAAASASVGAVSGADILRAIVSSDEVVNNEVAIDQAKNAAEIAVAKKETKDLKEHQKDAVVAGGIALRAMSKNGKFVAKTGEDKSANAINGVAASAVSKTLSALIIGIRNTIDSGLKEINAALATVKQEDKAVEAAASGPQ
ncbi:variable large family protein [Borrelia persica]|uniref:variable large family protein n=1 Tax=Borrelia persica TaxID=44448 RepID=UPI000A020550|nr:variable large family protein [Borrelia persica]